MTRYQGTGSSVEEAKAGTLRELGEVAGDWLNEWISEQETSELLDRLILEVQAAMPCYDYNADDCLDHEAERAERNRIYNEWLLCPSCEARAALKVPV